MSDPHAKLEAFFDGQLPAEEAEAFRRHYATCDQCTRKLGELMALDGLLERHHERSPMPVKGRKKSFWDIVQGLWWLRPALAFAAAIVVVVIGLQALWVVSPYTLRPYREVRVVEGRTAHRDVLGYQPLRTALLGRPGDETSLPSSSELAKLERRKDRLGKATAYLVRGQHPEAALKELETLTGPDADSERALFYLVRKDSDAGDPQEAIRCAERALAANPQHGPALWNKALATKQLGLSLMAARTFEEAAAVGEPGWDKEARERADELRRLGAETKSFAAEAEKAVQALRSSRTVPEDRFLRFPDVRWAFYDAVRASPSAEDVDKLRSLAEKLDKITSQTAAQDYLSWVAARDFKERAPLVKLYAEVLRSPDEKAIDRLWGSGEDDLAVGAMAHSNRPLVVGPELQRFADRCRALHDPWFEVLALQRKAMALERSAKPDEAIDVLKVALKQARASSLDFREAQVANQLIVQYMKSSRLDEAYELARETWQTVSRNSDWDNQFELIMQMGQVARLLDDAPLARAYLQEAEERILGTDDPVHQHFIHEQRAALEAVELRADAARTHLDAAIATKRPLTILGAMVLADVARMRPKAAVDKPAMEQFKAGLEAEQLIASERALNMDAIGRWLIETDPAEGRKMLREALMVAAEAPPSPDAARALTHGYTSLIMDAGKRGDFKAVLELMRQEAKGLLPERCLVAITTDSERSVVLALDEKGGLGGVYDGARTVARPVSLEGYVTPPLLASLERCPEVKVWARAPLVGLPKALPNRIAWSYHLGREGAELQPLPGGPKRLVVQNPHFSERRLKQIEELSEWLKPAEHPELSFLAGDRATPSAVLREMESADELTIVTHSLLNRDSGEAYLVLAEEPPGEDRLRAGQLKPGSLKRHPLVLLVACEAAVPAPVLWSPHGLPAAFHGAGARAVLAATEKIPADKGPPFFDDVRARIQRGDSPAIALREARQSLFQREGVMPWAESVLLFE